MKRYPVVTLCGSTRFKDEFMRVQKELTLKGYIVISVGLFGHSGDDEVWEGMDEDALTQTKLMLDDMHKRKIDMADEVYFIDVKGYMGESTKSEFEYAKANHKIIKFYSKPEMIIDEVGGVHDCAIGWNPNGLWCGECTKISCKNCSSRMVDR